MNIVAQILYRILWAILERLPLRLGFALGWIAGECAFWCLPFYRRLAKENLQMAFENELKKSDVRRLTARHFRRLGANLLSTPRLSRLSAPSLAHAVEYHPSIEKISLLQKNGRGVVSVLSHLSNWEIASIVAPKILKPPIGAIYQRIGNRGIDAHVRRVRERFGVKMLERRSGITEALKILRNGGVVGILADQNTGDSGIWSPFFRRLTSTSPLPGLLASRTGAALIPVTIKTIGWARWSIEAGDTLEPASDHHSTAAVLNQVIEQQIRKAPEDWFWVHNRWRIPLSNFLLTSARRGVVLPPGCKASDLKPFHILVRSPNWLGDAVMSIPTVQALRAGRPDARVTIATPEHLRELWEIAPGVDETIVLPRRASLSKAAQLIRKALPADVAVLLPNSLRSALEARGAGIRYLVGYRGHFRAWVLSKVIPPWRQDHPPPHQIDRYLRIAEKCGAAVEFGIGVSGVKDGSAPFFKEQEFPTIAICPGAEYGSAKRWPVERFAEAALAVSDRHSCRWGVVGLAGESNLAEEIVKRLRSAGLDAENLCGKTTLKNLIDFLRKCRALLTNDTGTMHLATFVGTPVVAVFGPTEPAFSAPRGAGHKVLHHRVPCAPCFLRTCPLDHRCMNAVSATEAAAGLIAVIENQS